MQTLRFILCAAALCLAGCPNNDGQIPPDRLPKPEPAIPSPSPALERVSLDAKGIADNTEAAANKQKIVNATPAADAVRTTMSPLIEQILSNMLSLKTNVIPRLDEQRVVVEAMDRQYAALNTHYTQAISLNEAKDKTIASKEKEIGDLKQARIDDKIESDKKVAAANEAGHKQFIIICGSVAAFTLLIGLGMVGFGIYTAISTAGVGGKGLIALGVLFCLVSSVAGACALWFTQIVIVGLCIMGGTVTIGVGWLLYSLHNKGTANDVKDTAIKPIVAAVDELKLVAPKIAEWITGRIDYHTDSSDDMAVRSAISGVRKSIIPTDPQQLPPLPKDALPPVAPTKP